jgi:hypothetical protein
VRKIAIPCTAAALVLLFSAASRPGASTAAEQWAKPSRYVSLGHWRVQSSGYWLVRTSKRPAAIPGRFRTLVTIHGKQSARVCIRVRLLRRGSGVSGQAACSAVRPGQLRRFNLTLAHTAGGPVTPELSVHYSGSARAVGIWSAQMTVQRTAQATTVARKAAQRGFWTDPIPASATADPGSAAMVSLIRQAAADQGFLITAQKWSTPVYHINGNAQRQTVKLTAGWAPKRLLSGVPIPADASPSPDGDGHLAIVDDATGCEYDFWQASRASDGSWSASWANATSTASTGWYPYSATGSGDALTAGLITPEDMASGSIDHALKFAFPYTKAGGPVLPAVASDGTHTNAGAIPEGAHLQLDPGLDLSTLSLTPWQKVVAKSLQAYGMYLTDTGGGVAIPAQETRQGQKYPWGTDTYLYLPQSLLAHLRVLTLPKQYTPAPVEPSTTCATLG